MGSGPGGLHPPLSRRYGRDEASCYGGADIQDIGNPLFLARVDRALLEYLVMSSDEAAASKIAELESDRKFKQMLCNYKSYKEAYLYA